MENSKLQSIAEEVLRLSRNTLLVNLLFTDMALIEPLEHKEIKAIIPMCPPGR